MKTIERTRGAIVSTLNHRMSEAELCRANGWDVGTRLQGTEGAGTDWERTNIITITAIGERLILARADGDDHSEGTWTLTCREWKRA